MKSTALSLLTIVFALTPQPTWADRAASPADATVFIRIIGHRRAVYGDMRREAIEQHDVEVATGSGFVVSPLGYVVTNHHVVSDRTFTRNVRGVPVEFTLTVDRIELIFPTGLPGDQQPDAAPRFEASVYASDPDLDLAVLFVSGAEFPYVALGDSDAIEPGASITALGYPFGRMVEVARSGVSDAVPQVNTSRGEVSALRADEGGNAAYIQTDATLNPGNSGGPMLDQDGFAVAVVRMVLTRGQDIGFGIPINRVKEFLRARGVDQMLPTPSLTLGPFQTITGKGVALRLPAGFQDRAPQRLRVDGRGNQGTVALRIDRVASPWSLEQLEQALLVGQEFDRFSAATSDRRRSAAAGVLTGSATGHDPASRSDLAIEYAIVDLGLERLIARFLGPAEEIAFNRSIFVTSLGRLDADRFLGAQIAAPVVPEWLPTRLPDARAPQVTLPAGWIHEPGRPTSCDGLRAPEATLSASPPGAFTTSFRIAWWLAPAPGAARAAAACSARPDAIGSGSYATTADWLGVSYAVEGLFVDLQANGLLQLEIVAPDRTIAFVRPLLDGWSDIARH